MQASFIHLSQIHQFRYNLVKPNKQLVCIWQRKWAICLIIPYIISPHKYTHQMDIPVGYCPTIHKIEDTYILSNVTYIERRIHQKAKQINIYMYIVFQCNKDTWHSMLTLIPHYSLEYFRMTQMFSNKSSP